MKFRLGSTLLLAAVLCCGCSPADPTEAGAAVLQPDPERVIFYDRPLTLAAARKSAVPSPVVVLLERDPWAAVIGSDSPTFALYDDGTVIQRTGTGFRTTHLSEKEAEHLLGRLNVDGLAGSYGGFLATDSTDQAVQDVLIYRGGKPTFISVEGDLRDRGVRSKVPKAVAAAYDTLTGFSHPSSRPWLPDDVEVMIWPYEYAPEPSILWPDDWPGLSNPRTVQRGEDYSLYMPSTKLTQLRTFLKRRTQKGAIEIDGKKWAASIRFPFPHENLWMPPHPELPETKR